MKRDRRPLPIPRHEFGFVPDTFRLIQDTTTDGERLCREREDTEHAHQLTEQAQTAFPILMPDKD